MVPLLTSTLLHCHHDHTYLMITSWCSSKCFLRHFVLFEWFFIVVCISFMCLAKPFNVCWSHWHDHDKNSLCTCSFIQWWQFNFECILPNQIRMSAITVILSLWNCTNKISCELLFLAVSSGSLLFLCRTDTTVCTSWKYLSCCLQWPNAMGYAKLHNDWPNNAEIHTRYQEMD